MQQLTRRANRAFCIALLAALLPAVCMAARRQPPPQEQGSPEVVRINEVLASNSRFPLDPQGGADDWVELYNPDGMAVDVGGCYLTDDLSEPTKWRFPVEAPVLTTIPAGGYLLIWADGDLGGRGLHASFRLNDEGEEIGLFAPDGETPIDSFTFGPQQTYVSYGRYPDGAETLRLMTIPTPASTNLHVHEGIAERPQVDIGGRLFTTPLTVRLTTETPDATIFYTLDGDPPFSETRDGPTGIPYTGPITISGTATLRAVAWKPGWLQSPEQVERYVFAGRRLGQFSSPLPIVVVDTLGRSVSRSERPAFGYVLELGEHDRATVESPVDFAGAASINVRGKSSGGFAKKQYHFETQDTRGDDKDVSILGMPAESDWVLQGPYSDKSLIRNVLAYGWSNEMGRYAPRTRLVEMFLNTDDAVVDMDDYVGVYVFMEKIKIAPGRVDITELEPEDVEEPDITGGYIIKKDKFDSDDITFNTSRGQRLIYQDPSGHELTASQRDWIRDYVNAFEAALYGPDFHDPVRGYAKYIDVDSFIDHHILVELCKNIDGFRLSTYMHKDREGKLHMGPAWDYNLSLGNADYHRGWDPIGWYSSGLGDGAYPYWRRLFQDPAFKLRYGDRWFALRRDLFATERMLGIIEEYASLLDEPAQRNFDRWHILGRDIWPNWFVADTFREEIGWLKEWVLRRLSWMDGQIGLEMAPAPPAFDRQGGHVDAGFELAMESPGPIYYTLDGTDPRTLAGPIGPTTGTVLVPEAAPKRVLVPTRSVDEAWRGGAPFDDSAWTLTDGGVGYERNSGYENLFTLDVENAMYNERTSCLIRVPFGFASDPAGIDRLMLRIRYDDGFVAYLNGVEIARRHAPGDVTWNSAAGGQNGDGSAVNLEGVIVPNFRDALRRGANILAIHGLNVGTTSSDFLISVELVAEEAVEPAVPADVIEYAAPIALTESTRVTARALIGGQWSAANEAVFAVGPVAESLRISEIMFHPPDDPNAEYVELVNVGPEPVNLRLVEFTDGIRFVFPGYELPPTGACLVVRDREAFEAKYGLNLPVAGEYTGALNNGGDRIELRDAAGQVIHTFAYDDEWYTLADGLGFSLAVADPSAADPNTLNDPATWRLSEVPDGTPGTRDLP